ncbi:MAG: hypothetical protein LBM93_09585, partial [Oscillospiraceae bacterium]|jgi:hypothetical protein|nr:hypothetical protein [Oscillospiraceae bacterium]
VKEKSVILYAKPIENTAISWNVKTVQSRDIRYPLFKSLNCGKIENFDEENSNLLNITESISSGNAKLFEQIAYAQNKILEYEFLNAD